MKVSVLYGDRLSPTSQERIVKAAEQHMDALSNTTRKLEENQRKLEENKGNADDVGKIELQNLSNGNSEAEKQVDIVSSVAIDNTQVDQMMGVGRNLDVIVDNS